MKNRITQQSMYFNVEEMNIENRKTSKVILKKNWKK